MAFIYDMTDTWNAAGTTFTAIKMNVTNTASAAASLLMDLQIGAVSVFNISKAGVLTLGNLTQTFTITPAPGGAGPLITSSNGVRSLYLPGTRAEIFGPLAFSTDPTIVGADIFLERDAANTLAQRNGANAQVFRVYNTYTNASNYERGGVQFSSNNLELFSEAAGTGTQRNIYIRPSTGGALYLGSNNTARWLLDSSGNFLANTDNTYDIGASGATRPRNVFIAGTYVSGSGGLNINSVGRIQNPSGVDGAICLLDNAATNFGRLQFGGTTNAFPSIKRSGTGLLFQLADDSAGTWSKDGVYTIASLPSATTSGVGAHLFVTDALTPVFNVTVAAGGAQNVPVYSNGTNWLVG